MSEEENKTDESTAGAEYTVCPCCGKPTLPRPVKPCQALTDHWLACMVTSTPFSHTYPVYGGRLNITVTRLTPQQARRLDRVSTLLEQYAARLTEAGSDLDLYQTRNLARMYAVITEITVAAGRNAVFHPQDAVMSFIDRIFSMQLPAEGLSPELTDCVSGLSALVTDASSVSAVPVALVMTVMNAHARVDDIMMATGFDENFWKGIELA